MVWFSICRNVFKTSWSNVQNKDYLNILTAYDHRVFFLIIVSTGRVEVYNTINISAFTSDSRQETPKFAIIKKLNYFWSIFFYQDKKIKWVLTKIRYFDWRFSTRAFFPSFQSKALFDVWPSSARRPNRHLTSLLSKSRLICEHAEKLCLSAFSKSFFIQFIIVSMDG